MEVIVIDDHSTDRTAELVERFIAENKPHGFRLIRNKDFGGSGKKDAITNGVNESSGELILCTDADCRPGPAWVSSAINYFSDEATLMVFGPVSYFERQGIINKFQSLEFLGLIATGAGAAGAGHPFICNGANLCYRKEAFRQVGGFMGNEKFRTGDDVFLMHKIKKEYGRNSIRFVLDKRLLVLTSPANGLVPFLNQRIRWASKSRGFRDRVSVIAVLTAFAFNLVLTALFLAGFFRPHFFLWFALALIFKSLTELTLIVGITGCTGSRKLMKWFLPFQVAYPFYVIAAGIFSLFWGKRW
jgi:cellulose synthase/poly-beta-1,6-N-acetylglucosamine synthase-like glycosyltransferase